MHWSGRSLFAFGFRPASLDLGNEIRIKGQGGVEHLLGQRTQVGGEGNAVVVVVDVLVLRGLHSSLRLLVTLRLLY